MSGVGRRGGMNPMLAGVIAGLLMLGIVLVMAKINIDFAAPWAHTHTLTVETVDADGIAVSSDVRINGRLVGQVTGVRAEGRKSAVTVHVDDSEWPLPATTTASIRLATLLGQKYVELETTTPITLRPDERTTTLPNATTNCSAADSGGHLKDGATVCDTKPVVDFDQILNQFDKPTVNAIKGIIGTASGAVQGSEGVIQQLIPDLRDLSVHSTTGLAELANRDGSINSILVNLGTVADQLNRSRNDLAGVIDQFNQLTGTLAQHQDALRGYIRSSDQINQLTAQVLGNGYAATLATDLSNINTLVHDLDNTFSTVLPQTQAFAQFGRAPAKDLIYLIGDATSQSTPNGHFLRQFLNSVDLCGIVGNAKASCTGTPTGSGNPSSAKGATAPSSGPAPLPVPGITLPPLPTVPTPSLPPVGLPGSGSSSSSSSSSSSCLLGVICQASDSETAGSVWGAA